MSKRRKINQSLEVHVTDERHEHTLFDKIPKDIITLLKDCIKDNCTFGVWVYWLHNDRVSDDVFNHIKFIKATTEQEAFIRIMENDWEIFLRDYIVPARQLFEEFITIYGNLITKNNQCECQRWTEKYNALTMSHVFLDPKKAEIRFSRSLCILACKKHFHKEFSKFMYNALLPIGKFDIWTELMADLTASKKLRLKPISEVYNPNINKSFY